MELTVDQALQQGVAAHKEGKLQNAERLYRAILQAQPKHPDANHNLGVLAVAVGKPLEALPFFKLALDANPKIEQFWLSYVDALIKTDKLNVAKRVLADAQQAGVAVGKLRAFQDQLGSEFSASSRAPQPEINSPLRNSQSELSTAIDLRESGKYEEAQEWLNKLVQNNPQNPEALSLLSQVLLLDKKEVEAEKILKAAASIEPKTPSVYRNQARLFLKQSKPLEALERAQMGCEQSPDDSESLLVLAACLGANQRDLEALPLIEKILKAKSNYAEAYANRALIRLRAKDTIGAIEDAQMVVSLKPHLTQMWQLLSSLYYEANNLSDAIEALRSAQKNEPENPDFMVQMGELLRQDNKAREAISILEQATALAPKDVNAWTNLGVAFQQEERITDAKAAYEKALALNPESAAISSNLGAIAKKAGEWESALQYFMKAVEIEPDLAAAHSNLGVTLQELGRLDEAEASYRQTIALKPDYAEAYSNLGNTLKELGKVDEAEASYRQAITLKPDYAEAYSNLGNTLKELGKVDEAEASYRQAITLKPDYAGAYSNLGNTLKELGKVDEAEASYRQAITLKPDYAEAYSNLGNTLKELGRLDEAEASYRQAITLKPDYAEACSNLGITLKRLGRLDEAEASYRQAITLKPDYAEACSNLGITLQELGRSDEAEASYRQAIALKPDYAEAYSNLGNTLQELGKVDEAEASCRQAIALKPDYAEAYSNLGNTLKELGRLDKAEASYRQAITLKPDYAEAYSNLGNTLKELGRLDEAEASYRQTIILKPDYAEAYSNLGITLQELGRLDEAEASYRQAITLKPDYAEAYSNLGITLKGLGRLDEAEASYRQAITLKPDFTEAHNNLLMLIGSMLFNKARYHDGAGDFARAVNGTVTSRFDTWSHSRDEESLRIGFVSGDLKSHPVGYFLEGLLVELQSSSVQLFAYPTVNSVDAVTARLKPLFEMWCPLVGLNDMEAAQRINGDGIHILIDLAGHTAKNRLPVFAWKPAPIQVSWLGYFASTGLPEMDYILGDPYVTPFAEAGHFVEKIWQLPETYLCFCPPEFNLDVGPLPASSNGFVTFGCLNQLSKMTAAVVSVRAKILHAVPGSKLLLKNNGIDVEPNRSRILSMFSEAGIPPGRLILEGKSTREEHLACYQRIDIALSPFPYNGGTTSVEGLWMGVPVITLRGDHFVSHVSESIVHNAGLAEWVAADEDEYIVKGLAFASDLNALSILRKGLREKVLRQPLFDAERFACHFEEAMFAMRKILAKSER